MGKITKIELSESERIKLNFGFKEGSSHCFRMRCKAVLLKSEGLSSEAIGKIVEMTQISVNNWVKRYLLEGISGLETRKGRGRKPIMDCSDEEAVRKAIENDRQSVNKAREAWQNAVGKEASESTFKRFLSALAQDISE
jgi:transposase